MTDDERFSKTAAIVISLITISLVKFTLGLYWTEAILGFVVGTTVLAALNFGIRRLSVFLPWTLGLGISVARMPGHRNILSTTRDKSFSNLRAAATSSEDLFGFFREVHRLSQKHFPELSLAKFEIENPLSKLTPCSLTALPAEDEIYDALRIEPDFPLALVKLEVETKFREPYWLLCGVDDRQNASVLNLDDWGVSTFDPNFLSFDRGNTGDPLWNHMLYAAHVLEKGAEILREREPSAAAPGFGM